MAAQGKTVVDAGGVVIQILATRTFAAATKSDLDTWINTYKVPITALHDPPGVGTRTLDTYKRREYAFILDLRTMKILERIDGSVTGTGDSSFKQAVPKLLALLAK